MTRPDPGRRSRCPIAYGLDVFGDQWTLLIIRDLLLSDKTTFRDFLSSPEGVATNVLADRLERLDALGIVTKHPDPDDRRRSVYRATAKGIDLLAVLIEIIAWSARHDPATPATAAVVRRLRSEAGSLATRHRRAVGRRKAG